MQDRPAPPVTIEGGPGWQLDGPPLDELGDDAPPRQRPPARVVVPVLAALLGLLAGALLHDWRDDGLREGAAAVLSVQADGVDDVPYFELVADDQGRLSTAVVVVLRNTGPRDVELVSVDLPGIGFAADDADGVRVPAGSGVRVVLLRPVQCPQERTGPPPPLRVRARTDAGVRERQVQVLLGTFELSGQSALAACGQVPPVQALQVVAEDLSFAGPTARLELRLRNASAAALSVRAARTVDGLSLRLTGTGGGELRLPLEIPSGDYSRPRQPLDEALPTRTLTAEVTVEDCAALPRPGERPDDGFLVQLDVDGLGGAGGTAYAGDVFSTLPRLRAQACPRG